MSENIVLVHGAWHGGWAWQPVASLLRAAGHRVWAPTCPGLGIDDDPRGVTLAGCVDSLVSQVEASFAVDVTLVGHSWGGYVIAGAAPRLLSRLKRLVFWSAFVPEMGKPLYDEVPPAYQELHLAGGNIVDVHYHGAGRRDGQLRRWSFGRVANGCRGRYDRHQANGCRAHWGLLKKRASGQLWHCALL